MLRIIIIPLSHFQEGDEGSSIASWQLKLKELAQID